jgi:HPt (histidine-containing phosphotransfer) domain-containing protein
MTAVDASWPSLTADALTRRFGTPSAALQLVQLLLGALHQEEHVLERSLANRDSLAASRCLHHMAGGLGAMDIMDLAEEALTLSSTGKNDGLDILLRDIAPFQARLRLLNARLNSLIHPEINV